MNQVYRCFPKVPSNLDSKFIVCGLAVCHEAKGLLSLVSVKSLAVVHLFLRERLATINDQK